MKFRVLGHRKSDAHRITLEFDAESKAAAERNAIKQGLEVVRVEIAGIPPADPSRGPAVGRVRAPAARRPSSEPASPPSGGISRFLILVLILVAAFAAVYWFWDSIKQHIPGLH